jgi:polyphosphate glucokinase
MNVLVVDVGGTHVKLLATGQRVRRESGLGPVMSAKQMVVKTRKLAADRSYNVVSNWLSGTRFARHPIAEPHNLGPGWVRFEFKKAFRRQSK